MTLDEAIKHYAEVAESKEEQVKEGAWEKDSNTEKRCYECAKECRQLAEWLRQLKEVKTLVRVTEKLWHQNARGGLIDVVDGYDILFSEHKQLREMFKEVNADDSN